MPKKQKINKRLDKLFKDISPEENVSKAKSKPKVREEAPPPPDPQPAPTSQAFSTPTRPAPKRHTSALVAPEIITPAPDGKAAVYTTRIQTGSQDWATLRLVDEKQRRTWTTDEQLLIKQVTDQLSLALENARLFQETQKRAQELGTVNQVITAVAGSLDLNNTLQVIANSLVRLLSASRAGVALMNEDKTTLTLAADASILGAETAYLGAPIKISESLATQEALRTRRPFYIPDAQESRYTRDIHEALRARGTKSLLIAPLITEDNVIGTIGLDFSEANRTISQDELQLLETIVYQTSTAIQKSRLFSRIEESETNLRALFSAMEDVVLVVNREGRYVQIAPTNPSLLVRPPEELLGKLMREVLPAETADYFTSSIQKALDGSERVQIEYELPIGDQTLWFLANLTKMDEDKVFWVARDITERRKAEEEISKFKLGIDNSADAVFTTDIDGVINYVNPAFEHIYGYAPEETLGNTPRLLKSGLLDEEYYSRLWNALLDKQTTFNEEIPNRAKDGNLVYVSEVNSPILDEKGDILGFLSVHHNITERKKAEETIRRRNEYLAATAEISRLITSTLDLNTIFARTVNLITERFSYYHAAIFIVEETGFNAVLKEGTGEAGAEMKQREHSLPLGNKSIVGRVASEGVPVVVNDTEKSEKHKFNPLLPETRAEAAIPLRIGSRIIGAIDVQAKVPNAFLEDEISILQSLADQVAVAIDNARSFELSQQAVMEMREADQMKSQFLANMSHELRTPLNSIIGFSRVILKGIDGPVTELMQQDLTAIYNSGQHLLGLINDILDSAKIEAGKMELAFDEVNIADLTANVLSTMSGLIKDKPVQMKRNVEENLPTVRADAIRVRQVMINLLSNAAKFTEEGDITVNVGLQKGDGGKSEVIVSVSDTGPGILEEDQEKLFQPFSQVDASPTRKTGGTGLGLSICRQLINMHGGRIWVESKVGHGTTFHFTLPLYRKESETGLESSKTILAIDDDSQVIGLYERYLQPQGYHVAPLTDPSRAVERAKLLKPFAITLDIMMPGIDGWSVLEALKSDSETRNIPVIVCSIIDDLEKGFSLGASDYLVKPIIEDDLVNALDHLNADGSIREVLVIDDNRDDLRLIGKMLNDDGRYKAILAEGGRSGWNIISSGSPPHAIVLDLFMPDMNGFDILEKLQTDKTLREIPVIVISGMEVTQEQRKQLEEFGRHLLTKGSFSEKELFTSIQRALDRIQAKK
ncbi:MAG: PAS domain S-box protein [Anaerolineaceae bacterium]|jgi:PAS domain S-box-containing protein|nr:MAG: PAS domain S-box protein [Anaerolineaceae bacterium]